MAKIFEIPTFSNKKGSVLSDTPEGWGFTSILESNNSNIQNCLPFQIKRVFWIFGSNPKVIRGGHRHHKNIQALIAMSGSWEVYSNNGKYEQVDIIDKPSQYLLLEPQDWHTMKALSDNAVLLVIASEHYDPKDYIDEKPNIN